MATHLEEVEDLRAGELKEQERIVEEAWEVRAFVNQTANKPWKVAGSASQLGGIVILAGGLAATVKVYDMDNPSENLQDINLKAVAKAAAGGLDRTLRTARKIRRGLVVTVDQSDATVLVIYK